MAKRADHNPPSRSKIRFILLEADLGDSDLNQITNAITNALRPALPSSGRRLLSTSQTAPSDGEDPSATDDVIDGDNGFDLDGDASADDGSESAPSSPGPRRKRSYPKPKVLNDLNLDVPEKPFVTYMNEKGAPSETAHRYLIVAAWFHDYAKTKEVTIDHVFTCYRKMSWGLSLVDATQPFRDLKRGGYGDHAKRNFAINHIGLGKVLEFKPEGKAP